MSKISDASLFNSVFREITKEVRKKTLESGKSEKGRVKTTEQNSLTDVVAIVLKRTSNASLSKDHELKVLVRAVLAWEFGFEVLDDAEFLDLSENILAYLKGDESLMNSLQKLYRA